MGFLDTKKGVHYISGKERNCKENRWFFIMHNDSTRQDNLILVLRPPSGERHSKSKNVVRDFIYGSWCNGRRIGGTQMPPLNELYIATILKINDFPVLFLDADIRESEYNEIAANGFRNIFCAVLMVSTQSFKNDAAFLESVKKANPTCKTILFGSHPTFMPAYCLDNASVDYIVIGEPEQTILELIQHIYNGQSAKEVHGIGYRDENNDPRINPRRPFINLDELPIPDRSLLPPKIDYFNPVVKRVPYTTAQTSRGCPFRCIFCTAPVFYGGKARFRSAESVLEELRIIRRMGYREVFFRDETFTAYKQRNLTIAEAMIREKMDITWIANAHPDTVDPETLKRMKEAGCHMVKFGIESGNNTLLENYKKGTTVEQNERAIRLAQEAGLETHAHFVFGGPGETAETIEDTIDFAVRVNPTTATFGILTPYPGTDLFAHVARQHPEISDGSESNMQNLHISGFYSESICGLTGEYLHSQIKRAYRRFYLRPLYFLSQLRRVTHDGGFFRLAIAGSNIIQYAITGQK
jgi:radical SAM superfamily enzyme YgiQ (UPF0313 family)